VNVRNVKYTATTTALCIWFLTTAFFCLAQSPTSQPQVPANPPVLVTGTVKSIDMEKHKIKVQTVTPSKVLETSEVHQITAAMNSTGNGTVTGAKTIPQKEYVYSLIFTDDVKVLKGSSDATLADVKAGARVEITGTIEKHEPQTLIDSYDVVNGKLVLNTVRSTQTQTATSIRILAGAKK
jgi:hypothetical protein